VEEELVDLLLEREKFLLVDLLDHTQLKLNYGVLVVELEVDLVLM
jgi:hypothetical protein